MFQKLIHNFLVAWKFPRWRWALLSALAVEAVPGLQLFPAWTLVVAALASTDTGQCPDGVGTVGHRAGPVPKSKNAKEKVNKTERTQQQQI